MIGPRILVVPLCALALAPLSGCKKPKPPPPRELASLEPEQACKHFFGRVKRCADSINTLQADKLKLRGPQRRAFLQQVGKQLARSFANLDLLCERYALKTRKQQQQMDRCYRERTCGGFARCFAKMADADEPNMGAPDLQQLRKQLQKLKELQRPGHMHSHGRGAMPKPRPHRGPKSKPRPRP